MDQAHDCCENSHHEKNNIGGRGMDIDDVTQYVTWAGIGGGIVGALLGALATHLLHRRHERDQAKAVRTLHLAALTAEIDFNARLAATYIDEQIPAPLYRFPMTVYRTVYAQLLSEILTEADVVALTAFYSQCEQMNRGLETIAQCIADKAGRDAIDREYQRLLAKAQQMRHPEQGVRTSRPETQFYTHARDAIQRHRQ